MSDKDAKARSPKESHGMREDIDENTPLDDIKAPNVFERVKEEIEAIVERIHPHKEAKDHILPSNENKRNEATITDLKAEKIDSASPEKDGKHNLLDRAKEGFEAIMHKPKSPHHHHHHHHHHKETHGRSDDIDENTPISEVKGPNLFERAKEEIEALVEAIRHKDESPKS